MKYTQAEKLQISMLCEIYRKLGIDNSYDPDVIDSAITSDNYWVIDWEYQSLHSGEKTPPEVTFVVDTIDMFSILEYTYNHMSKEEQTEVADAIGHFDPTHSLIFPGFDGNNESHYMTIAHMLESIGRFSGTDITKNSHCPKEDIYRRMLEIFLPARKKFEHDVGISKQDFINILNARTHPENR